MFFGGGIPFGFGDPHQEEEQEDQTLYQVLRVSQEATQEQLDTKYKLLTEKYSQQDPDQLGLLNEAYEVLSDSKQRKNYDKQLQQQKKMYEMMHGKSKGSKQLPKMQPTKRAMQVTLDLLYTGGKMPLSHERARKCEACAGKGGIDVTQCSLCKGEGAIAKMAQVGPGMFTQIEQKCHKCEGMGDIFGQKGKCQTCEGRKIVKKEVDLQVQIPPGAPPSHVITIKNEGNELHNTLPGDLILILQQLPHKTFSRKGSDLFLKKQITLAQALLGVRFTLTHLDNTEYTIYTRPGEIIGDQHKKVAANLGMPFFDEFESRGNLIIEFKVEMPKRGDLTLQQIATLSKMLPGTINQRPKDDNYEMLQDFDREGINSNQEGGKKQEDEEQDQEGGIGCQAQ